MDRVQRITDVKIEFRRKRPPDLVVKVTGEVPTQGWSMVQLLPRCYLRMPDDGIWEYDLIAQRPEGPVAQVVSQIQTEHTWSNFTWEGVIVGVRVFGAGRGAKELRFADASVTPGLPTRHHVLAPRYPARDSARRARIAPADMPYDPTDRPFFGPAAKEDCAAWVDDLDSVVTGDDMPFPF